MPGQLPYFLEYLHLSGLWERRLKDCSLDYTRPNAPSRAAVLGAWPLSILARHNRYTHVMALRNEGVKPGLLGMSRILSEDALRRALKHHCERERFRMYPLISLSWNHFDRNLRRLFIIRCG